MEYKELQKEKEELLKKLSNPEFLSDKNQFEEASRQLKQIESELNIQKELIKVEKKIKEDQEILSESIDEDLITLAKEDLKKNEQLKEKILKKQEIKNSENDEINENIKG
ncbi:MAG: hypothetical protein PHY52_01260, partial [Candidatus Pacebacteria bacterium]|nr:hypothetical protein [Candidatus Paceibacterota bacterium]